MSATQEIIFEQLKSLEEEIQRLSEEKKDCSEQVKKVKMLKEQLSVFTTTKNILKG